MTDSDTESFHSAVDSLSDQEEDVNINNTNVNNDEIDEGRKMNAIQNNKYEFDEYNEMQNKHGISEVLSVNWKEMVQDLSSFNESSNSKVIPERQNYCCLSTDEAYSNLAVREREPIQELKNSAVSGKMLYSQIEWPNSQCNNMETRKVLKRSEDNNKSDKIFEEDNQLFDINRFKDERLQNYERNTDKTYTIEEKDFEHKFISEIMDNVDNANMTEEVEGFEEKVNIDHDGWDDWEVQYPEKDRNDTGILDKESPQMLVSDEKEQVIVNSKSEPELKTKEISSNKSFWDWTEFSDVVAAVGKGLTSISSTVESGLGLPAPEELVGSQWVEYPANTSIEVTKESEEVTNSTIKSYSKMFAGFGANVVAGSLDVLEALGKKTFEKLTVSDQGSEKRRFIFEPERGQNLSEVLRELRENRAEEVALETNCITKRELTFIDFFEKFSGMLHLEGLEMLSKNYLRKIPPQRRSDINEIFAENLANTLEEYQENQQESFLQDFKEILSAIALPYNGSGLMDSYSRCQERLERLSNSSDEIFELFLECLADFTAQSVQSIHKLGQLLLITETEVKQEPFSELHNLIGRQISLFSNQFAQHISATDTTSEEIDELITAVFLAAGDSFSYVQQSFRLLRPLLIL
ncbi:Uncharacterized protein ACO02O_05614 [Dirofilaria immitis]